MLIYSLLVNMAEEENISWNVKLKKIDETRNYLIEEIKQNDLMSKKSKTIVWL